MPRYFLHIQDGADLLHDPDGQQFANLEAAQDEAMHVARELMADSLRAGRPLGLARAIVIADENGIVLAEVTFKSALPPEPLP